MNMLFLDTETTGVTPDKNAVVQIAGIVDVDGNAVEEFQFFARPFPDQVIEPRALEVIGRTQEEIMLYPESKESYRMLKEIIEKYVPKFTKNVADRFIIAGQNIHFDYAMMEAFWRRHGNNYWYASVDRRGVDLIQATRLMVQAGRINVDNFKLQTCCDALGIKLEAHDAMNDIRATRELYYKYIEMIKQNALLA